MNTPFTDAYNFDFLLAAMMGPNSMLVTEELCSFLPLRPGLRVLDLGCGMGLSSILLAEKYGATVFAADLWISPTDNYRRFKELGLEDRIIPVSVDAAKGLPFAEEYFDLLISVDSYHYFGTGEAMLPALLPCLKKGGWLGVAVPGLKREFPGGEFPAELKPFWQPDMNFHSVAWWRELWSKAEGVELGEFREMDSFRRAWDDWLKCDNPYAKGDIPMMRAEGGKYYNLVQMTARRK